MKRVRSQFLAALAAMLVVSCGKPVSQESKVENKIDNRKDYHSYSNPENVRVRHVALNLTVMFPDRVLKGTATLLLDRRDRTYRGPLMLDTRDLDIQDAASSTDGSNFSKTRFQLGATDKILGAPLTVELPGDAVAVRIAYATRPAASGLQWLTPAQTAGKKYPFLYTQSQAIHARSWIPLQDSPGVRVTYDATIHTPKELRAVMSAINETERKTPGEYKFQMQQSVPSYLIALAVGDLDFHAMGSRTGVYAEKPVVLKAAKEFEDTEKMIRAAEQLYGPYRWERYDILVLPPSFPYGGMENPRLTFVTPTLIAGDKSLVGVIAHELAHSWSGNLVTNATWRDFWLNEGFTTYFERRIQEQVYGHERAEMEAVIEVDELRREMADLPPKDEILHIDLKGRDPDEGFTQVPYVKGMLMLRDLETVFGRSSFDPFLRSYFSHYAFQSVITADFLDFLRDNLLNSSADLAARVPVKEWVFEPGIPASAPMPRSERFEVSKKMAEQWAAGIANLSAAASNDWATQEWIHFLTSMPPHLNASKMSDLDRTFHFTQAGNSEILNQWLLLAIRNKYDPAYGRLEQFLTSVGRRKYLKPLYTELAKTPEGKERARKIYAKARPGYHPIAQATVDQTLK